MSMKIVKAQVPHPRAGKVHRAARDTELAAAESVREVTGPQRLAVLALLRTADRRGLTDDEGGDLLGRDRLAFGRRRNELVDAGLVVDSGYRRPTPTGRNAIVWQCSGDPT